jgi:hypothetical protein
MARVIRDYRGRGNAIVVIYRCFAADIRSAAALIDVVRGFATDGTLAAEEVTSGVVPHQLALRGPDAAAASIKACPLDAHERAQVRPVGEFTACIVFVPEDDTPQSTFVCWEALTAVAVFKPCAGWINDLAYPIAAIERVALVRRAVFSDGSECCLFTALELIHVIEHV